MTRTNPRVDGLLRKTKKWQDELKELRRIVLDCDLAEEVKWRQPCYTLQGKNIVLISGFKEYCALAFVKGALLKDPRRILARPGSVQAGRQIRFSSIREIAETEPVLKAYIREAVQVERAGLQVKRRKTSDYKIPEE